MIAAAIDGGDDVSIEQLFARQVGPGRFELCCIPFFLYDIALGDVVETDDDYLVRGGRCVGWRGSTRTGGVDDQASRTACDAERTPIRLLAASGAAS